MKKNILLILKGKCLFLTFLSIFELGYRNGPEFFKPVKKTETQSIGMKVKVVDAQPFLKVQKTSLHNDSIMLIEGEM